MREIRRRTRVVGAFPDGQLGPQPGRGPAEAHRRHALVDQTVSEHGPAEGPCRSERHHRLSPSRPPLSQNQSAKELDSTTDHLRVLWRTLEAVEYATLEWVDWFNHRRLLEPIGNVPPAEAEAAHQQRKPGRTCQTRRLTQTKQPPIKSGQFIPLSALKGPIAM